MGIKGNFYSFLHNNAPNAFCIENISYKNFPRVALDTPIFLNKYKAIYGNQWRAHFDIFLKFFKNAGIELWCVFDGISPSEKNQEREQRKKNRQRTSDMIFAGEKSVENYLKNGTIDSVLTNINKRFIPSFLSPSLIHIKMVQEYINRAKRHIYKLSSEDFDWVLQRMFEDNFVILTAKDEAEKVCAQLCKQGICSAAMSDDSDLLAFQCPLIMTKFNLTQKTCQTINFTTILKELNMTSNQFVDFCIMCGTDFNKNCPNISTITAFRYINEYKSIENFAQQTNIDVSILNYERVRQIFTI